MTASKNAGAQPVTGMLSHCTTATTNPDAWPDGCKAKLLHGELQMAAPFMKLKGFSETLM